MITLIDARGCFLLWISVVTQLSSYQMIAYVRSPFKSHVRWRRKCLLAEECRMFKFLRTVAEVLGTAGLKVMTNGVRDDWLLCGRGFKASSVARDVAYAVSFSF